MRTKNYLFNVARLSSVRTLTRAISEEPGGESPAAVAEESEARKWTAMTHSTYKEFCCEKEPRTG